MVNTWHLTSNPAKHRNLVTSLEYDGNEQRTQSHRAKMGAVDASVGERGRTRRRSQTRRHSSKTTTSLHRRSGAIYDNGSKFKRFSSGRVNPALGRCEGSSSLFRPHDTDRSRRKSSTRRSSNNNSISNSNSLDSIQTHQQIRTNFKRNINDVLRKTASRLSNSSDEIILARESFNSSLSAPQGRGLQKPLSSSQGILVLMKAKNQSINTESETSLESNEDRILAHLIGNYDGPDRMGFAAEIVREVRDLSELSADSVIDFLLSKQYQAWIKQKQREWESMIEFKAKITSNSSTKSNPYTALANGENRFKPVPKVVSLVQMFQDSISAGGSPGNSGHMGGVQNHYNYEININTTVQKKRMLRGFGRLSCCTIL